MYLLKTINTFISTHKTKKEIKRYKKQMDLFQMRERISL